MNSIYYEILGKRELPLVAGKYSFLDREDIH